MAITSNPQIQNGAVSTGTGSHSFLNISATTAVKSTSGRIVTVNVTTAGSAVGEIYDYATTSGFGAANLIATIPDVVGSYVFNFPCAVGIVIVPPTGGVVSVSYN